MTDFNKYGAAFKCSFITSLLVSGYVIGIYENHRCMDHEKLTSVCLMIGIVDYLPPRLFLHDVPCHQDCFYMMYLATKTVST